MIKGLRISFAIDGRVGKIFFCKNKYHIGVVHVPSFHLSAKSSSFFRAFFLHFYGKPFYGSPDISKCSSYVSRAAAPEGTGGDKVL